MMNIKFYFLFAIISHLVYLKPSPKDLTYEDLYEDSDVNDYNYFDDGELLGRNAIPFEEEEEEEETEDDPYGEMESEDIFDEDEDYDESGYDLDEFSENYDDEDQYIEREFKRNKLASRPDSRFTNKPINSVITKGRAEIKNPNPVMAKLKMAPKSTVKPANPTSPISTVQKPTSTAPAANFKKISSVSAPMKTASVRIQQPASTFNQQNGLMTNKKTTAPINKHHV